MTIINEYINHGWALVPIPAGSKGPNKPAWNKKENCIFTTINSFPSEYGVGIAHAYSGTMALDIDDWDLTETSLKSKGVDLNALFGDLRAVSIDSNRKGRGKILYAIDNPLPSKKVVIGGKVAYEFRCATAEGLTVQDVLPPSLHPVTGLPYEWGGMGNWKNLLKIPNDLLKIWNNLINEIPKSIQQDQGEIKESWEEIVSAVKSISPDLSRDEWITVGMALKWISEKKGNEKECFHLWNDWSKNSVKYPGERELIHQWTSFKNNKPEIRTLGSLLKIARQYGWQPALPDVHYLFDKLEKSTPDSPEDLVIDMKRPAPTLDLSIIPKALANRAEEISKSVGCDVLVPLFSGLSAVCAVADARSRLELAKGFQVPPVLWLMTIGSPADKKTPGSRPMLSPLRALEAEDRPKFKREVLEWEGKEALYSASKKAFLEFSAKPESVLDISQAPDVSELPPQPVALRLTVDDITSQKLVRLAADRPRGMLCALDEMSAWVKKLVDKFSPEDRSAWVKAYEACSYDMDRVNSGSIHVENLAISIYGNIQPKVFKENLSLLASDGLLQRFIPCILNSNNTKRAVEVNESFESEWEQVLRVIFALPPITYKLSKEAKQSYGQFQDWYELQRKDEILLHSGDAFMTAFGKLEGLTGRLALVFHLIEYPFSAQIEKITMDRAIRMIKEYVIPAYRYAFSELSEDNTFDTWLRDYLIHYSDEKVLTLSQIKRSGRRQFKNANIWQQDQIIFGAMHAFEQAKWVIRLDDGSRETQHQAEWAVNPNLLVQFGDYRKRVIQAKQRQLEEIYKLSTKEKPKVKGLEE